LLLILIFTIFISINSLLDTSSTICIFKNIFDINCIGCGISKSIISVINGNFKEALNLNYTVIIVFPLLIVIWFKKVYFIFIK